MGLLLPIPIYLSASPPTANNYTLDLPSCFKRVRLMPWIPGTTEVSTMSLRCRDSLNKTFNKNRDFCLEACGQSSLLWAFRPDLSTLSSIELWAALWNFLVSTLLPSRSALKAWFILVLSLATTSSLLYSPRQLDSSLHFYRSLKTICLVWCFVWSLLGGAVSQTQRLTRARKCSTLIYIPGPWFGFKHFQWWQAPSLLEFMGIPFVVLFCLVACQVAETAQGDAEVSKHWHAQTWITPWAFLLFIYDFSHFSHVR